MKSIIVVFILMSVFLIFGSNAQTMNMMNMSNMTQPSTSSSNNTTTKSSSATSLSSNINECITMVIVFSYLAQKLFNN